MKGSFILVVVVIIACVACVVTVCQLRGQERTPAAPKPVQQPRLLAPQQKLAITVEVKGRKLFVNGKLAGELPQTEAISVTVADGKLYVNGKRVWTGKTDQFILRLRPEELRKPAELREPQMPPPELRAKRMEEFIPPAPPPYLTEKEKEEFKRDMQKWQKKFQEHLQRQRPERELDARRKQILEELERLQQRKEQLGRQLRELQQRAPAREKAPAPTRPGLERPHSLEPQRGDETTERIFKEHLKRLLEDLEKTREFIEPRVKEFLKRAEKIVDEHIQKVFDRWLEKKLSEEGVMDKAIDRLIERMQKNLRGKELPLPRRELEPKRPPR